MLTALAALTFLAAHPGLVQTAEEVKALRKEVEALKGKEEVDGQ